MVKHLSGTAPVMILACFSAHNDADNGVTSSISVAAIYLTRISLTKFPLTS